MTSGKDKMGEKPIFTCKAHVFHIDPKTKRSWVSASCAAVNVSFFYDFTRSLHRIISVEGQNTVINSTVTPNMTFTKTSQKFGQWSDVRANTVYGLGFSSEAELEKFVAMFNEVKEKRRNTTNSNSTTNGTNVITPVTSANASPITTRSASGQSESGDNIIEPSGLIVTTAPTLKGDDENAYIRSNSVAAIITDSPSHQMKTEKTGYGSTIGSSGDNQLKYENDRLKLALAQSSANAKKWEIELSTLKNNNARLTSALQESTANVDEWKRQLASLKEENARMRMHTDLDISKGGDVIDELRKEIEPLKLRIDQLEIELAAKNAKCKQLMAQHQKSDDYQFLQKENQELQTAAKVAHSEYEMAMSAHDSQRKVLLTLGEQLASRVQDLATIHDELTTALQT